MNLKLSPEVEPYPARLELQADEPSYGLLMRTAEYNGAIRPYSVYRRFGVHGGKSPNSLEVDVIAAACKADAVKLRRSTPALTASTVSVLGEVLDRNQFSSLTRRWCPHCLQESPHHRVWWDLVPVTTCPFHGVELVTRCECDIPLRTIYHFIGHCRHGHELAAVETTPAEAGSLMVDDYMVRRLLGVPTIRIAHLDDTPLEEVVNILEQTGRAILAPGTRLSRSRHGGTRRHLLASGFAAVADEDLDRAFHAALDRIASRDHAESKKWGLEKTYGELYVHLVKHRHSALASAMIESISRHGAGKVVLKGGHIVGHDIDNENSLTMVQSAKLCGLTFERFRRLAVALDLVPKQWGQGTPFRIDREKVEALAERLDGHKDLSTIAQELGVSDPTAARIARSGLIDYVVIGGLNARDLNKWIIHRDAANKLLRQIDALVPTELEVGDHLAPMASAARLAHTNALKIIELVLSRTIAIRGIDDGKVGLNRYLLSKSDVQIALRRERAPGMTLNEAIERIGIRGGVVTSWLRGGLIAHKKVGRITTISEEEVERFLRDYITVPALSELTGLRWKDVKKRLAEAGVPPVAKRPEFEQILYERDRALRVLTAN